MASIKLTNNVKISSVTSMWGIDTSNLLAENVALPYTATQDCYFWYAANTREYGNPHFYINDTDLDYAQGSFTDGIRGFYFIKKGDRLNVTANNGISSKVFGLK